MIRLIVLYHVGRAFFLDFARVPELGFGGVLDGVRHMMSFALDLMTPGKIEEDVDAEYINGFEWYHTLPEVLAVEADAENGVPNGGEVKCRHMGTKVCKIVTTQSVIIVRPCNLGVTWLDIINGYTVHIIPSKFNSKLESKVS